MNEMIITPFIEGFKGCFRLILNLFVAVARAVVAVSSDFVNGRSPESCARKPHT